MQSCDLPSCLTTWETRDMALGHVTFEGGDPFGGFTIVGNIFDGKRHMLVC